MSVGPTRPRPREKFRPTSSGLNRDGTVPGYGCSPINVAARSIALVIECARVMEIAQRAHTRLELYFLAVPQIRRRLAVRDYQRHTCAALRGNFHGEMITS